MIDYDTQGSFNFSCELVKQAFPSLPMYAEIERPLKENEFSVLLQKRRAMVSNIKFADSLFLKVFADCIDFDFERLKKRIIKHNSEYILIIDEKLNYEGINNRRGRFHRQ